MVDLAQGSKRIARREGGAADCTPSTSTDDKFNGDGLRRARWYLAALQRCVKKLI